MLSYMIPVDTADKPPPVPSKCPTGGKQSAPHLNLNFAHHQTTQSQLKALTNGNGGGTTGGTTTAVHRSCLVTNAANSTTLMSKDSSVNSFASDATTGTGSSASGAATPISNRGGTTGTKMVAVSSNGGPVVVHQQVVQVVSGKHHNLKRVSFGSSKGSMVETLIYESPLQEEPEPSPIPENGTPFPEDGDQIEDERERVRVSFVQHSKPQEVQLPDEPVILTDSEFMMAAAAIAESNHVISTYTRQESTESGWDNPFRPGGDLSREADEIVELIKGGKPITPTSATAPAVGTACVTDGTACVSPIHESPANKKSSSNQQQQQSPSTKNGASSAKNGGTTTTTNSTGPVNVQRGTTGQPSGDVEHVVLKKEKSKCKCCVVQ